MIADPEVLVREDIRVGTYDSGLASGLHGGSGHSARGETHASSGVLRLLGAPAVFRKPRISAHLCLLDIKRPHKEAPPRWEVLETFLLSLRTFRHS